MIWFFLAAVFPLAGVGFETIIELDIHFFIYSFICEREKPDLLRCLAADSLKILMYWDTKGAECLPLISNLEVV